MNTIKNIGFNTKDTITARVASKKMKDYIGEELGVTGLTVYEDDGKRICVLKTDSGEYVATNSKTFTDSILIVLEDNDWCKQIESGTCKITVESGKSNSNRDFIYPVFPTL